MKWAGGKSKLTEHISKHYCGLDFKRYVELFFGGGSVYFDLVNKNSSFINNSLINDINKDLMQMYCHIKTSSKKIIEAHNELIKIFNKKGYYYIRERYNGIDKNNNKLERYKGIERSAALMVINKTCFNGLYRVNRNNKFNVPEGRYKRPSFISKEAIEFFAKILPPKSNIISTSYENIEIKKKDFVYIDPPYDPLSKTSYFASYSGDFVQEDQEKLKEHFDRLNINGAYVILSNSNTKFIRKLYSNYKIVKINAARSINSKSNKRDKIKELIIIGSNFNI